MKECRVQSGSFIDVQGRALEKVSVLRCLGHGVFYFLINAFVLPPEFLQDTPSEKLLSGVGCSSSSFDILLEGTFSIFSAKLAPQSTLLEVILETFWCPGGNVKTVFSYWF